MRRLAKGKPVSGVEAMPAAIRRLGAADAQAFQALQESPGAFGSSHEEERGRSRKQIAGFLAGSDERVIRGGHVAGRLVGMISVGRALLQEALLAKGHYPDEILMGGTVSAEPGLGAGPWRRTLQLYDLRQSHSRSARH